MPGCCAVGCSNRSENGFKIYSIPSGKNDQIRKKIWLSRIKRENFEPKKSTGLCECHFESSQFEKNIPKKLKPNAVPTLFAHIPQKAKRKSPRKRRKSGSPAPTQSKKLKAAEDIESLRDVSTRSANIAVQLDLDNSQVEPSDLDETPRQSCEKLQTDETVSCLKRKIQALQKTVQKLQFEKDCLETKYQGIFNSDQVRYLELGKNAHVTWTDTTVRKAMQIRFACGPTGYDVLLHHGLPLPSDRTLRRRLQPVSFSSGILEEVFIMLADKGEEVYVQISFNLGFAHARTRWRSTLTRNTIGKETIKDLKSDSLLNILVSIKEKLQTEMKSYVSSSIFQSTNLTSIIESLDHLGWENIESVDEELKSIILKATDGADRQHLLHVCFSEHEVNSPMQVLVDLPENFIPTSNAQRNLLLLYEEFQEKIESYQLVWNVLDDIDSHTWVLEPEIKSRKDTRRRVALSKEISLLISVSISQPTAIPECEFYGPDKDVAPLRNTWLSGIELWNEEESTLANLTNILSITFPSVHTTTEEDIQEICIICYSFRLNGSLPEKTCDNLQCRQIFHAECLYEWLHKLSTTKHSFNTLFGECPCCNKPITCKMP